MAPGSGHLAQPSPSEMMRRWLPILMLLTLAACGLRPESGETVAGLGVEPIEVSSLDAQAPLAEGAEPAPQAAEPLPDEGEPRPKRNPAQRADLAAPPAAPEETPAAAEPAAVVKSPAQLACEKRGGRYAAVGSGTSRACVRQTKDAGKQCRKESDCSGRCLARSGTCAPVDPLFGCNDILQSDGRRVTLCLD